MLTMRGFLFSRLGTNMTYRQEITTNEEPLEQRNVSELIGAGYSLDLLLQHKLDETGASQYYLYAKYRNHLRPIYTQRNAHRAYTNLERAVEWGKRMGFKWVSVNIDYSKFPDSEPTDED